MPQELGLIANSRQPNLGMAVTCCCRGNIPRRWNRRWHNPAPFSKFCCGKRSINPMSTANRSPSQSCTLEQCDCLLVRVILNGLAPPFGFISQVGVPTWIIRVEDVESDIDWFRQFAVAIRQAVDARCRAARHEARSIGVFGIGVGSGIIIKGGVLLENDHDVFDVRSFAESFCRDRVRSPVWRLRRCSQREQLRRNPASVFRAGEFS